MCTPSFSSCDLRRLYDIRENIVQLVLFFEVLSENIA